MSKKTKNDSGLTHTRWNCKYHIVFTSKYSRKIINGKLRADIGKILRRLCELKDVEIIEACAMPDYIYMLVKILPKNKCCIVHGLFKGTKCSNYP